MQLRGYVSPVGQMIEVNNKRKEPKVATKYFEFYIHSKYQIRRGYVSDPRRGES